MSDRSKLEFTNEVGSKSTIPLKDVLSLGYDSLSGRTVIASRDPDVFREGKSLKACRYATEKMTDLAQQLEAKGIPTTHVRWRQSDSLNPLDLLPGVFTIWNTTIVTPLGMREVLGGEGASYASDSTQKRLQKFVRGESIENSFTKAARTLTTDWSYKIAAAMRPKEREVTAPAYNGPQN